MTIIYLVLILMLAIFVGFELIRKVPSTLHTPLMSGANAISGITVIGALSIAGGQSGEWSTWLGAGAVLLAAESLKDTGATANYRR
jgi:NAD(P) transhydrogenase subunit alpha